MNLLRDLPDAARRRGRRHARRRRRGCASSASSRIGQASPAGFWYDQDEAEWVLVLAGAARLRFADESLDRVLAPGDWVDIAPHRRHRVEWTDPATPTVWLAVFHNPT